MSLMLFYSPLSGLKDILFIVVLSTNSFFFITMMCSFGCYSLPVLHSSAWALLNEWNNHAYLFLSNVYIFRDAVYFLSQLFALPRMIGLQKGCLSLFLLFLFCSRSVTWTNYAVIARRDWNNMQYSNCRVKSAQEHHNSINNAAEIQLQAVSKEFSR